MLPKVSYAVDQYHGGQFLVMKMVDGRPEKEMGRYWDLEEAKRDALKLSAQHIAKTLFPEADETLHSEDFARVTKLVQSTRTYFEELLHILPVGTNGDAQQARLLVRQAFNFARTAILMDGMV